MKLTPEQNIELAAFPPVLKSLIEAELAAGNSLLEIGGGHPAPPIGACAKLEKKVTTRPRASDAAVSFYERNSSSYCGEFTDGTRQFFVLEAPEPPPPEPDMDAIRKSLEPKPDPIQQLAKREPASRPKRSPRTPSSSPRTRKKAAPSDRALTLIETATGATRVLHFRDSRPPHEVQFALERELMTLFSASPEPGQLRMEARGNVNGAPYSFEFRFEAALRSENCYSLRAEGSWADHSQANRDYFNKTSEGWFKLWTRDLTPANPPEADEGLPERYLVLANAALQAEAHLNSIAAVQQAIVTGVKQGGTYGISHKEGGSHIHYRLNQFVRTDHGDDPGVQVYADEADFLKKLRSFCYLESTRMSGNKPLPEFEEWKLILRRMSPPTP
ncbi:MAG: hypothetical protein U1G08_18560 [Verrucomicrobiota bacterium]